MWLPCASLRVSPWRTRPAHWLWRGSLALRHCYRCVCPCPWPLQFARAGLAASKPWSAQRCGVSPTSQGACECSRGICRLLPCRGHFRCDITSDVPYKSNFIRIPIPARVPLETHCLARRDAGGSRSVALGGEPDSRSKRLAQVAADRIAGCGPSQACAEGWPNGSIRHPPPAATQGFIRSCGGQVWQVRLAGAAGLAPGGLITV